MSYIEEVQKGMDYLAQHPDTLFVGQAVEYKGTAVTHQVKDYEPCKLLELPVAEDFQAGFCLGLALEGKIPVSIYPRMNFAILAANQIVNHLDKWPVMSDGESRPKVIMKAIVGSRYPLDPGHQHKANYTQAFKSMCDTINVVELLYPEQIFPEYKKALDREDGVSTLIVEHGDLYK
jgi:pyruvate/2-oxoglutarate/acetoin dehydrogenase E1 component